MIRMAFVLYLASFAVSGMAAEPALNPELATEVGRCATEGAKKTVFVFKQWHLSPATITKDIGAAKKLPQFENQNAIYRQLSEWITQEQLKTVFAEGCNGEIKDGNTLSFNGWSFGDLLLMSTSADYVDVLTHVPLKLEAQFDKKIATHCGDDLKLVKEHSLMFSDVRGNVGFLSRINQNANDEAKLKPYLESVGKIHKMKSPVTVEAAKTKLVSVLTQKLERIKKLFSLRNQSFVNSVKKKGDAVSAIVIGGLHAEDLKKKLEDAKLGCVIVEPKGYHAEDEKLVSQLYELIKEQK